MSEPFVANKELQKFLSVCHNFILGTHVFDLSGSSQKFLSSYSRWMKNVKIDKTDLNVLPKKGQQVNERRT